MSGIFGFIGRGNAFLEVKTGLENLSHRGQESWGIVTGFKDGSFSEIRKTGSIFKMPAMGRLHFGSLAIGHVRYPTAGETSERNSQPVIGSYGKEKIAIVHNGHVPRYRQMMEKIGGLFQTDIDTEVILQMIVRTEEHNVVDKTINTLSRLSGEAAFSLIILHHGKLIVARDPFGFRPLSLGRRGEDGFYEWAIASETCAFGDRFDWMGDVEPGQLLVLDGEEVHTFAFAAPNPRPCILECLDYASPASHVFSQNVYEFREKVGARLAQGETEQADMVVPVPRAAVPGALGFHNVSGISFKEPISTVGEIGRIFIVSKEKDRLDKMEKKFQINRETLKGKDIMLIDTLLVRGSTAMILIPKLRAAGVRNIHFRLTAPPPRFPCFMGMAMAKPGELLATNRSDDDLKKLVGADTFRYLKAEELHSLAGKDFCDACLTGNYPFQVHNR